ncbi:MAG: TIGR03936 family radical SAM-associated protein [Actinomycetota bacterium]|nr:TIGR03936 family radical SAM-associated protein [Actinomycetota bacterium]
MEEEAKIRFKFIKLKEFKYLSHLETVRFIVMAINRAKINVKYSKGFNPNPRINFSFPIPVGLASMAEYSDIEITERINEEDFKDRINLQLKECMKVVESKNVLSKVPSLMSDIAFCSYCFKLENFKKNVGKKIKHEISIHPEFCHSIYKLDYHEIGGFVVNLSIIGYTKTLENNKVFKFNEFLKYFKYLSNNESIVFKDYFKEEAYVLRKGNLKTPLDIV